MSQSYLLFYDADCGICTKLKNLINKIDNKNIIETVSLFDSQAEEKLSHYSEEKRFASAHLVTPSGKVISGGYSIIETLKLINLTKPIGYFLGLLPKSIVEKVYNYVANNRKSLGCKIDNNKN